MAAMDDGSLPFSYIPLLGGIAAVVGKENGQEFLLLKQTPLYGKMLAFYLKVLLERKNCVPPFNLSSCTSHCLQLGFLNSGSLR